MAQAKRSAPAEEEKTKAAVPAVTEQGGVPAGLAEEAEQYAGQGVSRDMADRVVPMLRILQDMSPQVKKRDPAYIEGAEPGFVLNTATKELWPVDEYIYFQPCAFQKMWVTWKPRAAGGGFIGQSAERPEAAEFKTFLNDQGDEKQGWKMPNGDDVIETRYHFGNILDDDKNVVGAAMIAMSSTGHTASRQWMELMNQQKLKGASGWFIVPSWFKAYRLGRTLKSRNTQDWYTWDITTLDADWIGVAETRAAGKALYEAIASGARVAAPPEAEGDEAPI